MKSIDLFLIDVEGTIVVDKSYTPVSGAVEWINELKRRGRTFLLVTNNTTHAPDELAHMLSDRGFDVIPEQVHSCLSVAVQRIRETEGRTCFVIGSPRLKGFFQLMGLKVVKGGPVDWVVVGLDVSLSYQTLKRATMAVTRGGAKLMGLHANRLYRDVDGQVAPSVGAVVRALEYACGIHAEIVGKPNPLFFQGALKKVGARAEKTLMIGDDPFSDLVGAKRLGIRTAFVLSGKYADRAILDTLNSNDMPDLTVERINEIGV